MKKGSQTKDKKGAATSRDALLAAVSSPVQRSVQESQVWHSSAHHQHCCINRNPLPVQAALQDQLARQLRIGMPGGPSALPSYEPVRPQTMLIAVGLP